VAILRSTATAYRPILVTTIAFRYASAALLARRRSPHRGLAGVIVGGQVLSLLLTLLATPVIYSPFDGGGDRKIRAMVARR